MLVSPIPTSKKRVFEEIMGKNVVTPKTPKKSKTFRKKKSVPVMSVLQPELKYSLVTQNQQSMTAGTVFTIAPTQIAQGDDFNMRSGMKISPEWLRLHAVIGPDIATGTAIEVRRLIFIDWGTNGAVPAAGEVLQSVDPKSVKNYSFAERFKILKDDYQVIWAVTASGYQPYVEDTYISLSPHFRNQHKRCSYQGTGSSVTSQGPGQIYIMYLTDTSITGGAGNIGLSYSASVGYFDA